MEDFLIVVAILAFAGFAIFTWVWRFQRSDSLLRQWADQNGFRIISQEYRSVFTGPFFWTTSKGQTVYYVVVKDSDGNTRGGWVRCGGWFFGLLSDNVDVSWEY